MKGRLIDMAFPVEWNDGEIGLHFLFDETTGKAQSAHVEHPNALIEGLLSEVCVLAAVCRRGKLADAGLLGALHAHSFSALVLRAWDQAEQKFARAVEERGGHGRADGS